MSEAVHVVLVLPSLKTSGGVREALRLAADLVDYEQPASVLTLWSSVHPMASPVPLETLSDWVPQVRRAFFELPVLALRFARWRAARRRSKGAPRDAFVFTHYSTLPLALSVPRDRRYFFVQDLEWRFIGSGIASQLMRRVLISIYRSGRIISANAYLTRALVDEALPVALEAPIWADRSFAGLIDGTRDIDFVMILRKGAHKRLDLYLQFIENASTHQSLRIAVITPEDEIASRVSSEVKVCLLRPTATAMKSLYSRSKYFVHLSEHEGFGLPPLEAMGSGCVPICRDSGGVRAYMSAGPLSKLLVPRDVSAEHFFQRALALAEAETELAELRQQARATFDQGFETCAVARRHLRGVFR